MLFMRSVSEDFGKFISKFKAKVYPAPQEISALSKQGEEKKSSNTQEFKSDKTILINLA